MTSQQPGIYMVELLYESAPQIDPQAFVAELERRCGPVELLSSEAQGMHVAFLDTSVRYGMAALPAQLMLSLADHHGQRPSLAQALEQSWGWADAGPAVEGCRSALLITDMLARGLDYKERLRLIHAAVESAVTLAPCRAIHWAASQQIVDPDAYMASRREPQPHPLQFALNVRFFNISNGTAGEHLMDTMGLAPFGLPDLQCHYTLLEPQQVAQVLYNTAYYIFEHGDIIEDGHTTMGIATEDRWRCQHEVSFAAPSREVLDLNPGPPYAAGDR